MQLLDGERLNGFPRDQAVGEDPARLAGPVRPVHGLRLDGGVPPGVEEEYVLRRQAGARVHLPPP